MTSDLNFSQDGRPRSDSEREKLRLEHEAARLFMRLYEECFDVQIRHIWHNEPIKPDVSCYLGRDRLDLEIAHLYGSEAEAMLLLGRDLGDKTWHYLHELNSTKSDERLLTALNRILGNKAQKNYHSQKVWLVIRNMNPLWTRQDFLQRLELIHLPDRHPFEAVWVVADFQGISGLVRIFPPRLVDVSGASKVE
ncbi:MAG: hypothetical protein IBX50_20180 [Marinospirillum sp.]|uniref:hypothetical protein n=1 Tax=Marinospirillum sp. TaxID=2183934 RepID=UPI001A0C52AD|nr:hypothetical protein [Marinospirillum sp.]MBE0509003.1 hypothetical protein [Marinospirillum sp.]